MNQEIKPVIVQQSFHVSISQLWKAISELEQMKHWFFENLEAFSAEVGFETQFNVKSGERNFMHLWKISEVIPLEKLVYSWKYEGYEGESFVSFETFITEGGSSIRVSHVVTHSFPQSIPEFTRESCQSGWEYFINNRLKNFMDDKI
ncbi:SRPBCC domain-containing protein [Ancylomarina euxinus]|uniref:SRPBCC domain-containing protein n=1 Tax=Ancylomarina euxinus TaxID=2283627 RepID=A0A425XYU7_9BACT|nr:SRPBCC domain-containing protein [Ancylomarina euxinus]MCZ4695744.1 SRPBCC domain-containing protein [Ancylomarina euxinus]MUP16197.1 SRPBCC domain-containing protein [Ancylomarina euxinus]RRG20058.1 SRPBCC domain-containing protein [Ancylomarina euxinus]